MVFDECDDFSGFAKVLWSSRLHGKIENTCVSSTLRELVSYLFRSSVQIVFQYLFALACQQCKTTSVPAHDVRKSREDNTLPVMQVHVDCVRATW